MATIDNLTLEITADSSRAITALNNLSTAMGNLKRSLPTKTKLDNVSQGFKSLATEISKLSLSAKNLDKIKAIGTIAKNFSKFNDIKPKTIENVAKGMTSLTSSVENISYESINKIEKLSKALKGLPEKVSFGRGVNAATKKIATDSEEGFAVASAGMENIRKESANATESVGGFWSKYKTVSGLIKSNPISLLASSESTKEMGSLAQALGVTVSTATALSKSLGYVGIAFTVVSGTVKIATKAFKALTKPITNVIHAIRNLAKAVIRIGIYRMIRSALKSISQGLKEGIQNLALYSKALEGLDAHNANNVLSRYASEFLYFKNAVATAVIPVLRALIPIVETAINTLIKFINVLAQVGSAVFGSTYTKAKYFWVDYADSLDNASGSAKKLHHQLAGFDELNNLTAPSGGGGASKLEDAKNMFEEALIDPKIKKWVDEVVKKIKNGLSTIKQTLQPVVDKIKNVGEEIRQKVMPHLTKIWENLKIIWNDGLKPILEGFFKGFFANLEDETIKNLPDFLERVAEKVEKVTGFFADLSSKTPNEKLKRFGEILGFITAKILYILNPFNALVSVNEWLYDKVTNLDALIKDKLKTTIENITTKIDNFKLSAILLFFEITHLTETFPILGEKVDSIKNKIANAKEKIDKLKEAFNEIKKYLERTNPFEKAINNGNIVVTVLTSIKSAIEWLKGLGEIVLKLGVQIIDEGKLKLIGELFGLNTSVLKDTNPAKAQITGGKGVKGYASGGFVGAGDLFIANERGAEMVGSIGSNTAVANNDQITEAIAVATYNAMSQALSENGVHIVVESDGDKMFKVWQKKQREYQRATGLAY